MAVHVGLVGNRPCVGVGDDGHRPPTEVVNGGLLIGGLYRGGGFRRLRHERYGEACAAAYNPEANVLVPRRSLAEERTTPASKAAIVWLERVGDQAPGRVS